MTAAGRPGLRPASGRGCSRPGSRRARLGSGFGSRVLGSRSFRFGTTRSALVAGFALIAFLNALPGRAQEALQQVWVLPIEGAITGATAQFVARSVARANAEQPLALVLAVDTPGGQLLAAEAISNSILQDARVPTIAVVTNAISAGALIAMSAEQLVMLPGASIGAATAVNAFTGEQASEKVNSAWRSFFRNVAEARGRNPEVAEGMVSERVEIPGLSSADELITLTSAQALEHDIADLQAASLPEALEALGYGGAQTEQLAPNAAERLGGALANPLVAALLLIVGVGGLLFEAFSPGFGVPGIVGALALATFAAGLFIASPAGPWAVALLLGGVLLIALELLVFPGFGVAGILGLAMIAFAVVWAFPGENAWIYVLGYASIFGALMVAGFFWLLPNSRLTRTFALSTRLGNAPGTDPERARLVASYDYLRGQTGVASSDLRPAGVARIAQERLDVVSEGEFIPSGSSIEVLRVEGARIVVRRSEGASSGAAGHSAPASPTPGG